jgi:hypothetical protein
MADLGFPGLPLALRSVYLSSLDVWYLVLCADLLLSRGRAIALRGLVGL